MNMTKIKTAELQGAQLDWAVAKALGWAVHHRNAACYCMAKEADGIMQKAMAFVDEFRPSTDWAQGGPLIHEYRIGFGVKDDCYLALAGIKGVYGTGIGETHLIAAMRALVAAKLGDEVEVPNMQQEE